MNGLEFVIQSEDEPRTVTDAAGLGEALAALAADSNNIAPLYHLDRPMLPSGFPDHELHVAVDAARGVGALRFMADGTWYTKGTTPPDGVPTVGSAREFPEDSELPLDAIRAALAEFLETRERPTSVDWQVDPMYAKLAEDTSDF